jgi:hypothetical protein
MSAKFSEVQVPAERVLFRGHVPAGHWLRLDDGGTWRLEAAPAGEWPKASVATPADDGLAFAPDSPLRHGRWKAFRGRGGAGVALLGLLACVVAAGHWTGRSRAEAVDGRPGVAPTAADPLPVKSAVAPAADRAPRLQSIGSVTAVPMPSGSLRSLEPPGSPGSRVSPGPLGSPGRAAALPSADDRGAGAAPVAPVIVPSDVLGGAHARVARAARPAASMKRSTRARHVPAPGVDEQENTVVLNEGAAPALPASRPAPAGIARRTDRLVALPDDRTALVTDPPSRVPRVVPVGDLLPSGARLVSVDPGRGVAVTDRGTLELR